MRKQYELNVIVPLHEINMHKFAVEVDEALKELEAQTPGSWPEEKRQEVSTLLHLAAEQAAREEHKRKHSRS